MNVLIQMCFIHVTGGYINVAQITTLSEDGQVCVVADSRTSGNFIHCHYTGDKTSQDFLRRIEETCGGKSR